MSKKASDPRTFNISVVGLSGLDQDQSLYGVGKSCLCNRFVRPLADEYITEHTSVFSNSDFSGRVINNDQFLYWGNVKKISDEGNEIGFQVFEQTEFIDDASLMTLSRGGALTPYAKRCAATKLSSPEKLMYLSRDQVALQNDYLQVTLPAGKLTIDGFVVVYDAEASRAKQLEENQERMLSSVVSYVQKSKKPFVIAVTKCDDTQLNLLQEVHRFAQGKKLNVPIIETSSHENVNVDLTFNVLAQLIERGKVRSKIPPFSEAQKNRRETIEKTVQAYQHLISRTVTDFRVIWKNTRKAIENEAEFKTHRDLCGLEACKRLFNKHIRKLRKEFEERKLQGYLERLPKALDELLPTVSSLEFSHWDWEVCQNAIRNHKAFSSLMIVLPDDTAWNESDHLMSDDERIPFDVLLLPRSEKVFQLHVNKLKEAEKRVRMMNEFRKLLELTPQIHPGAQWLEAALWLQNEESFLYLEDSDKTSIFDTYSRTITEQAKIAFQELLFESAALFSKLQPNSRPSFEDMTVIKEALSKDDRYKKLEKLDNVRDILLFNHIALMHSPGRCLSGPEKCRDRLMQEIVSTTTYRPQFMDSNETLDSEDSQLNIRLIGSEGLAQELEREIQNQSSYGDGDTLEYAIDGRMFEMDLRVLDFEVDNLESLTGTDASPQGCLCVYGSRESLQYIQEYLDAQAKNKFDSLDSNNAIHGPPPTVLILAHNPSNEDNIHFLRKEGQRLASRFEVSFIDVPLAQFGPTKKIHDTQVVDSVRALLEGLKQQSRKTYSMEDIKDSDPDLKILLCAMCGDPYPVELILGPLFHHQSSWRSPAHSDTIILETYLGYEKKKVMITLTSYHRASSLNYQMFHGYILVYSAIRKASLATLSGFSASLPQVPIQVLAVTGSASGASVVFHSNVAASLLADGTNLASKLCAKFQTTSTQFQHQAGAFATFFNNVWENKADSESAYAKFLSEQKLRYTQRKTIQSRRPRDDPLPDPPSVKPKHEKAVSPRRRSYSERTNFSPKSQHRLSESALTDPELSQYAVVSDRQISNIYEETRVRNDMQPYATSTPNALFGNAQAQEQRTGGAATPTRGDVWEKRPGKKEAVYAVVSKKRLSRKSDDSSMDDSEVNLIENSLYANKNLSQITQGVESKENPPPLPQRNYDLREEFPAAPAANGLSNHVEDEGYSTIPSNHHQRTERQYESVDLPPTDDSTKQIIKDPSAYNVRDKVKLFENEMRVVLQGQDVWVKMNCTQNEGMRASFPELAQRKGGGDVAPLAQQEDVSDPEYAQVQDALKQQLRISDEGSDATLKKHHPHPLRTTHSAEDISTLERRRDSFNRPQLGMNTDDSLRRGTLDSMNSDWGTGDEASLPRPAEQHVSRKKAPSKRHWHISRSKSSARKGEKKSSSFFFETSQDDSTLEGRHRKPHFLNIPRRGEPGDSDMATEEDTEDDVGPAGKTKKKSFLEARPSRKKANRDEDKAEKQRKKEEKKQKREDEKKAKKIRKFMDQKERQRTLVLEKLCTELHPVPLFVEKCLDYVEKCGMQTEGIYRISGNKADIELVDRSYQERGPSLELSELGVSVHAVTGSLKSFLKKLQGPLIPKEQQNAILEAMVIMNADNRLTKLKTILSNLPACNLAVFKCLMFHLNRVTEYSKENLMESRNLSTVLFPTIIRPDFASLQVIASQMNYGLFVQTCIEKCDFMFEET